MGPGNNCNPIDIRQISGLIQTYYLYDIRQINGLCVLVTRLFYQREEKGVKVKRTEGIR